MIWKQSGKTSENRWRHSRERERKLSNRNLKGVRTTKYFYYTIMNFQRYVQIDALVVEFEIDIPVSLVLFQIQKDNHPQCLLQMQGVNRLRCLFQKKRKITTPCVYYKYRGITARPPGVYSKKQKDNHPQCYITSLSVYSITGG